MKIVQFTNCKYLKQTNIDFKIWFCNNLSFFFKILLRKKEEWSFWSIKIVVKISPYSPQQRKKKYNSKYSP